MVLVSSTRRHKSEQQLAMGRDERRRWDATVKRPVRLATRRERKGCTSTRVVIIQSNLGEKKKGSIIMAWSTDIVSVIPTCTHGHVFSMHAEHFVKHTDLTLAHQDNNSGPNGFVGCSAACIPSCTLEIEGDIHVRIMVIVIGGEKGVRAPCSVHLGTDGCP